MPELPEIEGLREELAERLPGRRPTAVSVRQFALVKTAQPPLISILGVPFVGARRQGKHLLLDVAGEYTLAIHLGIGGRLGAASRVLMPFGSPKLGTGPQLEAQGISGQHSAGRPPRSLSLDIALDDGSSLRLFELGSKKRSSVHLLPSVDVPAHLAHLGVDALSVDLTLECLGTLLKVDRVQLKHFLTDQRRIAGIGNAYSDEILWEAQLPPLRLTTTLEAEEIERLHGAVREVLTRAIATARRDNYLSVPRGDERGAFQVHRRSGQPCPRCGEPIASIYFAESSLQYCPACQVEGRRYADRRLSRLLR